MNQVKITETVRLTAAFQTVHTAHFQRHLTIKNLHIANTTAVDATVRVTLTPASVAPAEAYALLWDFTIPGNDFIEFGEGQIVPPGATIAAQAGAVDSLVIHLSGIED